MMQVAGLPYQLAVLFSGCPDHSVKLSYLRDILDVEPLAADFTQPLPAAAWDASAWFAASGREAAAHRNPLTARYLAALITKELAERCEVLK